MKMGKIIIIVILLLAVILTAVAVTAFLPGQHPAEQPGTTWSTKDGCVVFHVKEDSSSRTVASGYICTENGRVDLSFAMSALDGGIDVYTPEDYSKLINGEVAYPLECWIAVSVRTDRLVVKATYTTYFEEGQELVFFKETSE